MNNSTRVIFRGSLRKPNTFMADEVTLYVYVVTLVLGIIGNSLVVLSIVSRRRRRRMTANDVFILNLTVSDLLLLLFFIPYAIFIRLAPFRPSMFICKSTAPIITVALGGMVYTLTAMAVQRCMVITQPFRQECSVKRATLVVAVIWVASIGLSIPKIAVATPKWNRICISKWKSSSHIKIYTVTLFVLRFAIPFCVIFISYAKLALALLKTQAPRFAADSRGNIRDVTNRKENLEVVKTLVVITFLFFVLMLPFRVTRLMKIFGQKDETLQNIYQLTATLVIAHSCINPIIFGTIMGKFSQDYRRFFTHLFCCKFCSDHDLHEDETLTQDRFELEDGCEYTRNCHQIASSTIDETLESVKTTKLKENSY